MQPIQYRHVTHPRARNLKIKIEASGEVVVVTPKRVARRQVAAFVEAQRAWIEQTLAKVKALPKMATSSAVQLFGKTYTPQLQYDPSLPAGVSVQGNTLIVNSLNPVEQEVWQSEHHIQLERFLVKTARAYILPRTKTWAELMHISYNAVSLKQQKTRWGSCSSQGNLNFNWRLVHFTPAIIDYVIIHELAHRKHMDHSRKFWELVQQFDPEYQRHRGILKRAGGSVG